MFVVEYHDSDQDKQMLVGPFTSEYGARHWAGNNMKEGEAYQIRSLMDIAEATL